MNEVEKALGLNDNSQPKVSGNSSMPSELGDNNAEKVIVTVAYVILIVGCLASLISGLDLMDYHSTVGMGLGILVGGILGSIISWALLMVVANISNNIRQIKHELRKKH